MIKNLIKGFAIIALFILGSYLIATYAPWKIDYAQGFALNFILQFLLFAILGFILKTDSFKRKKWNKKEGLMSIVIIAISFLSALALAWWWLFPQWVFGDFSWMKFANIFVGRGIIFFFPLLLGFESSRLLFE